MSQVAFFAFAVVVWLLEIIFFFFFVLRSTLHPLSFYTFQSTAFTVILNRAIVRHTLLLLVNSLGRSEQGSDRGRAKATKEVFWGSRV